MKPIINMSCQWFALLLGAIVLPCLGMAQSFERSVLATAGGNFSNSTYSLDYTFGETVAQTLNNGDELSQGFQQVWVITTAVDEAGAEDWKASVFPNPTIGSLMVETEEAARVRLFDASGRVVLEKNIESGKEEMNLGGFPAGLYTLQLKMEKSTGGKTFRIVKIE